MMSILRDDGRLYVKGALEAVLPLCSSLDEKVRETILNMQSHLARQGFRVLALAERDVQSKMIDSSAENDLEFVGLAAMKDPPRPFVNESIHLCRRAGIHPVMITGDHKETAIAIAKEIGLMESNSIALDGKELDLMDDTALDRAIVKTAVFARVTAEHKLRIIQAWKNHGHIVAMTGDGVNDAPALKKADIGIAMGITGTEVAKQASDMVILDDHFATIVSAIKEGRAIYNNIVKFIHFLLSSNFAELMVVFIGFFFSPLGQTWTVLLPAQILWINFITDGFPSVALAFDDVEKSVLQQKPRKMSEPILTMRWLVILIVIGLITAFGSLLAAYFGFLQSPVIGRTMAFTELVLMEFGILFFLRMPLSVFSNISLVVAIGLSLLLQAAVIYVPWLQALFGTIFLHYLDWMKMAGIAVGCNLIIFLIVFMKKKKDRMNLHHSVN
jgi:Ca2+-transporting ATPase